MYTHLRLTEESMATIDYIAIIAVLVGLALGALFGFGKLLKFFTGGIVGVIISLVVTYFCIGVVASWTFVQELMAKLITAMQNADSKILNFLLKIGVEKILLAVILFIVIQILRIIIVNIIKGVMEINNPVLKVINRVGGAVLMLGVLVMLTLLVFHVAALIGGSAEEAIKGALNGSVFKLDWVFDNNPMQYIIEKVIPNS